MDSDARPILLGVVLGVLFVVGIGLIGLNLSVGTIKTASLPIEPPIMFMPK